MAETTFLIPGLDADPAWGVAAPRQHAMETIVCRGTPISVPHPSADHWLLAAFGLDSTATPFAPYAALGDGIDPGSAFWMHADPVNLAAQRSDIVLLPSDLLDLQSAEADSFVASLNSHFAPDGLQFFQASPGRWYVRCHVAVDMRTRSLDEVSGQPISRHQPSGRDAQAWMRMANDAQMVLHAHPLNEARDERGERVVNGLWFWGGGTIRPTQATYDNLFSDEPRVIGLARAAGRSAAAVKDYSAKTGPSVRTLVTVRRAANFRLLGMTEEWSRAMQEVEAVLLKPALAALRAGELDALTLLTDGRKGLRGWQLRRKHLWRVWRPLRALS
jgi:hypothetical protein